MISLSVINDLYAPPDADAAHEVWGANCGPCALAALAGVPLATVREHLADFENRGYMNPTQMKNAIRSMGMRILPRPNVIDPETPRIVHVQFGGPWMMPGVPLAASYRYTHWVAVIGNALYDCNVGVWIAQSDWHHVAKEITDGIKRCDGRFYAREKILIDRATIPRFERVEGKSHEQ